MPYRSALWQCACRPRTLHSMAIEGTTTLKLADNLFIPVHMSKREKTPAVWIKEKTSSTPIATVTNMDVNPKYVPFQKWATDLDVQQQILSKAEELQRREALRHESNTEQAV